ncbi:MAG: MFS transporter [Candidatus Hodarchaeales archaeon]|jgi:MFS family permease
MFVTRLLGTQTIPEHAKQLISTFLLLSVVGAFLGNLSSTFFVLFAIDNLGFAQASIVMSFMLLIQLFTDYPSGSLGDWIGQRWVLTFANLFYAISYYLLTISHTFSDFLILALFFGLGNAQASGALETWLDNNYQKVIENTDPERKIYGFSMARIGSMNRLIMAIAFVTGGAMATLISRQHVFFIQGCMTCILIVMVLFLVKNVKVGTDEAIMREQSTKDLFKFLKGGIGFLVSSKTAFFFLVGNSMIFASFNVWGTLILFPVYFGYTGSDGLASVFRTILFLIGIPIGFVMANVSKKFSNDKVPHFSFLGVLFYYPPFIVLLSVIPITNSFNLLGLIFTSLILTSSITCLLDVANTLRGRTLLDLVPSENRNAVYSLIPTIISVFAIPLLPVAGTLIEDFGLRAGIMVSLVLSFIGAFFIFLSLYFKKNDIGKQLVSTGEQES